MNKRKVTSSWKQFQTWFPELERLQQNFNVKMLVLSVEERGEGKDTGTFVFMAPEEENDGRSAQGS